MQGPQNCQALQKELHHTSLVGALAIAALSREVLIDGSDRRPSPPRYLGHGAASYPTSEMTAAAASRTEETRSSPRGRSGIRRKGFFFAAEGILILYDYPYMRKSSCRESTQRTVPSTANNCHLSHPARGAGCHIQEEELMHWQSLVSYFFGGACLTNAIPHLVSGLTGKVFSKSVLKACGCRLSSSTV